MSIGLSAAWRAMQPKQKKCDRCGLYYTETLAKCSHCGDLDESGLRELQENKNLEREGNASMGRNFLFVAILVAIVILLSVL